MSDASIRNLIQTPENFGIRSERTLDQGSAYPAICRRRPASKLLPKPLDPKICLIYKVLKRFLTGFSR